MADHGDGPTSSVVHRLRMNLESFRSTRALARVAEAARWRKVEYARVIQAWLASCESETRIALRWPWPLRKPWQQKELCVWSYGGGLGDELMCTPVFRAIKEANPGCRLTFLSRYPELFREQAHLDAVEPLKDHAYPRGYALTYGPVHPPRRPLVSMLGECIGLHVPAGDLEPLRLPEPEPHLASRLAGISRPRVAIQPLASRWTENKQWPRELWSALVRRLVDECEVIEVGTEPFVAEGGFGPRFHSFAGQTGIEGFAQVIASADVFVGPVSGGMHLANALRVPSVIIFGGYEAPSGHYYSRMTALYSALECAPCWLPNSCPHSQRCLNMISSEQVIEAVRTHLHGRLPV